VRIAENNASLHFVQVLIGPDNTSDYGSSAAAFTSTAAAKRKSPPPRPALKPFFGFGSSSCAANRSTKSKSTI